MQFTVNKGSIEKKLEVLRDKVKYETQDYLEGIAEYIINVSPVDTGAYVTSHSVKSNNTSSRGRSKTSKNKPRHQNPQQKRAEGFSLMLDDIERIMSMDENINTVTFRNDSPHATNVEHQHGYKVYTKTRNRFK